MALVKRILWRCSGLPVDIGSHLRKSPEVMAGALRARNPTWSGVCFDPSTDNLSLFYRI